METQKSIIVKLLIVTIVFGVGCFKSHCQGQGGQPAFTSIPFKGLASGGTLVLCSSFARNADGRCVAIKTSAGQPAESVVETLASAIALSNIKFS